MLCNDENCKLLSSIVFEIEKSFVTNTIDKNDIA